MMIFGKKQQNNRAYPRADFFQPSFFIVEDDTNQKATECWCNNISVGGLAFESERGNLNDAMVRILYKIGNQTRKDSMQVRFSHRLMSRFRYGCQFTSPDPKRNDLISRYVDMRNNK
jgi:hypothetical protein